MNTDKSGSPASAFFTSGGGTSSIHSSCFCFFSAVARQHPPPGPRRLCCRIRRDALHSSLVCVQDEGMVDVRSRRCQEPSCTRQPSFGFEHQKPRFVTHEMGVMKTRNCTVLPLSGHLIFPTISCEDCCLQRGSPPVDPSPPVPLVQCHVGSGSNGANVSFVA